MSDTVSIELETFNPSVHGPLVSTWRQNRAMGDVPEPWSRNAVGIVANRRAAIFLLITQGGVAYVEGFVASPETTRAERDALFAAMSPALELIARSAGCAVLIGVTANPAVVRRALENGWEAESASYTLVRKRI